MPRRSRSGVLTVVIVLLAVVGVASLSRYGWLMTQMEWLESKNRTIVSRMLRQPEAVGANTSESDDATADVDADFIGELDIPRLNVSAAVKVGEDADVLKGAVGYIPETPLPWQPGNSAFAAHRDRIFRPLADIHVGDEIRLSTRHGDFRYLVSHTLIVNENDVWVLDNADDVDLTLITCYPFVFVGHAPQRFVVRAKKVAAY
jgi:sortase A